MYVCFLSTVRSKSSSIKRLETECDYSRVRTSHQSQGFNTTTTYYFLCTLPILQLKSYEMIVEPQKLPDVLHIKSTLTPVTPNVVDTPRGTTCFGRGCQRPVVKRDRPLTVLREGRIGYILIKKFYYRYPTLYKGSEGPLWVWVCKIVPEGRG